MCSGLAHNKHILLIEDDLSLGRMLSFLLIQKGFQVTVAVSIQDALTKLDRADLILLDLNLPDGLGLEICQKVKDTVATKHIPIIIISARSEPQEIINALYLGAEDYLIKPFDYEELIARINVVLRSRIDGHRREGQSHVILELKRIIEEGLVVPFFQPIFRLKPFQILGFESLCRPLASTILSQPELLFKAAQDYGYYNKLEWLSWGKALAYAAKYLDGRKLFLNCGPQFIECVSCEEIMALFEAHSIRADHVVLEITERSAIVDYCHFFDKMAYFRKQGFSFAIDDVGNGYASLESIVQTRPELVKIDRHIIHDIHGDPHKKNIVKLIVEFCKTNGVISIAEGIETKEELAAVYALEVDAGQGFYLSKPDSQINNRIYPTLLPQMLT